MSTTEDLPLLWKPKQIAKYFGVHIVTVYRWIEGGDIIKPDEVVRMGSRVRVKRDAIVRLTQKTKKKLQAEGDAQEPKP